MKRVAFVIFSLFFVLIGCNATSNADANGTARLTIFHTNDFMGYLTPCG